MNAGVNGTYGAEDSAYLKELWHLLVEPWVHIWEAQQGSVIFQIYAALCIGVTIVGINSIYHHLPIALRLLGVPLLLYGAYLIAERVVVPYVNTMIRRC